MSESGALKSEEDRTYRKTVNAWAMYDWANSAFATIIISGMFPPFYRSLVTAAGHAADATAYWAYTASVGLFLVAILGPVLGAVSDHTGGKKKYIAAFAGLGILSTALLPFLDSDAYLLASALFIAGRLGFAGGNVFYESLLPHVARKEDIDQVSTRGYAMGYVGGGILLAVNVLWIMQPAWFAMPGMDFAVRVSFFSVAVWWALFSLPLFRNVTEPPVVRVEGESAHAVRAGFERLSHTFGRLKTYRQLLLFLVAFWVYNDGIGTIQVMALAFGDEIGIGLTDMIAALLITQFIGIPCTFGFGLLARRIGTKHSILLGLGVFTLIAIGGFFVRTAAHFYALAILVGMVQGGTQALSRSLYAAMIPRDQAAEFFGFFSTSAKFAGILGPVLFGVVSQITGGSRLSIASLVFFFVVGGLLLWRVDEKEGIRVARKEEVVPPGG
ncbi:MAG: MFS transporter [bacterium]|nr:MFS transporter [bacterium]